MKKVLLCLFAFCSIFMITGCTSEKVSLNLKELAPKIDTLQGNTFDRLTASELLNGKIEGLVDVYEYEFKQKFNLTVENISEYSVSVNEGTNNMYFILKPNEGKKDSVKTEVEAYLTSKNVKEKSSFEEVDGYLIYIVADNSKDLLNEVKNAKAQIFGALMQVEDDLLTTQFGIEKDMVEEYLIKMPMMITNSHTYIIVKPTEGKKDVVKEKLDTYMTNLEEQWKTYLPDQYELVKNRLVKEYGDYLIYIVSSDNEAVFNEIKANNQA